MFQNWGFLLGEVWGLILLATLLGLFCGWLIWDRSKELAALRKRHAERKRELELKRVQLATQLEESNAHLAQLQELDAAQTAAEARIAGLVADNADLRRELKQTQAQAQDVAAQYSTALSQNEFLDRRARADSARISDLETRLAAMHPAPNSAASQAQPETATTVRPVPITPDNTDSPANALPDYDGDGVREGTNEGRKPATLTSARHGTPDDLKKIKGVGPKLEAMLHNLGFFHFDQVAAWSADEIAWVDANLGGFNGRVSRDRWIDQARILAAGGTTEFAARVDDGAVYS